MPVSEILLHQLVGSCVIQAEDIFRVLILQVMNLQEAEGTMDVNIQIEVVMEALKQVQLSDRE
jgi:hypothetical protein